MCKQHISQNFNFICYTDDPLGVFLSIQIVPFVNFELETITHNKLYIFSKDFNQQIPPGPRVFFDLDLVIKSNIDHIVNNNQKHITLIFGAWFAPFDLLRHSNIKLTSHFYHNFNSSCMTWESDYTENVWEHFLSNMDVFRYKYWSGMDSFLYWERQNFNTPVYTFPKNTFYSFYYGVDYFKNKQLCKSEKFDPKMFKHITEKIPVILFNGPTTYNQYKQNFNEFYSD